MLEVRENEIALRKLVVLRSCALQREHCVRHSRRTPAACCRAWKLVIDKTFAQSRSLFLQL